MLDTSFGPNPVDGFGLNRNKRLAALKEEIGLDSFQRNKRLAVLKEAKGLDFFLKKIVVVAAFKCELEYQIFKVSRSQGLKVSR